MTVNWDITPEPTPAVPRPPVGRRPSVRRSHATRRSVLATIAVALVGMLAIAGVPVGSGEARIARHAAGSRLGQQDPFAIRRPENLLAVWSADFLSDPTALLVDGDDALVVTPNAVTALATADGRQRWRTDVKDAEPYLAADATTVFVAAGDGFEALDRATGRSRWRVGIDDPADIGRTVALVHVGGEEVAVATTEFGGVVGLDGATGAVRWSVTVAGSPRGRLTVDDATGAAALLTTRGEQVELRVLDAGSGAVRWDATLERDTGVPAVVAGVLVVGTARGSSHAAIRGFALADGSERWNVASNAGFEATTGPAVHGSTVVMVGTSGTMWAIGADSGEVRWKTHLPGPVLADSPAVTHGLVVVHDTFAQVHTLDLRTGRLLASRESLDVPLEIGGSPDRIVVAQAAVAHGQVTGYAPAVLGRSVRGATATRQRWSPGGTAR